MAEWQNVVVPDQSSVKHAINTLNQTSAQIVLCVDKELKFVGIVVDGDIRRGLINGVGLEDPISMVMNRKPYVIGPNKSRSEAVQLMETLRISHIPIVDDDGFLCGLHAIADSLVRELRENLFVIMAGGFGRRMGTLTSNTPKPMLEIADKPILEHLIVRARNSGFLNFALAIHYLGNVIEEFFGDGSRLGVKIEYLRETEPLGTAGAIKMINPIPNSPFIVSNADLVSNIDFAAMLDFHLAKSCDATMAVRIHQWQNPFGVVEIIDGRINEIVEKPIVNSNISAGIFVLDPSVIQSLGNHQYCDMPTLFQRLISNNKKVFAFPVYEEWTDIGHKAELDTARMTAGKYGRDKLV